MREERKMIEQESMGSIRPAVTQKADPYSAEVQLKQELQPQRDDLVLWFAAPDHDPDSLQKSFNSEIDNVQLIACPTAGEITLVGYLDNSVTAEQLGGVHINQTFTGIAIGECAR